MNSATPPTARLARLLASDNALEWNDHSASLRLAKNRANLETVTEIGMARAEAGAKPVGAAGRQERKRVKIASVDPIKKVISFYDADGRWREVSLDRPDLEHYLEGIKDADTVEVVFTEALAVSITAP